MATFLQTTAWEQVQQRLGRDTYWLDGTLYLRHELKLGLSYWYAPRAEIVPDLSRLDAAFKSRGIFVRFEPATKELTRPWRTVASVQPRQTLLLDLTPREEELLASFHQKTRYNIRLAEKKGVVVERYTHPASLERLPEWLALNGQTSEREQITAYPDRYYATLLDVGGQNGLSELFVAYYDRQPLAALILMRHADTATFLFGASSGEQRSLMAPYLLQWTAILAAKQNGLKVYDWWGVRVDEELVSDKLLPHPGRTYGVTKFKLGFGGQLITYPPAYDRSYSQLWYSMYSKLRKARQDGFCY